MTEATTAVSALARRVREASSAERANALVAAVSAQLPPSETEEMRARAAELVGALHDLADALAAPEDAEDLYRSLAAFWLERRFEWERCNQVANYRLYRTNTEPSPRLLGHASIASGVLAWIEELCSPDQLDHLGRVTLELLDEIRPDIAAGRLGVPGAP